MNVVYMISRAKKGAGPINQALNILTGLNRIPNVHAILVTLENERVGDTWLDRFRNKHIDIIQLHQSKWNVLACVSRLKAIIKDERIDIVHSSGFRADIVNILLKGYAKVVSTQRNYPNQTAEKYPFLIRKPMENLHLTIIKKVDVLVACSKSLQQVYYDQYGLNVSVVQNGVDTDYFKMLPKDSKFTLRERLGIPTDKTVYLFLGRISQRKNISLLIQSFQKIDRPDIELIIAGKGPMLDSLRYMAKNDNRIIFLGRVDNPLSYIQASDILVSASLSEGLPNSVLEALSCGVPCILSDIAPHKEIIGNKDVGAIFERNNSQCLKDILERSLEWDLDVMTEKARIVAQRDFSIERLASEYFGIYKDAINL